MFIRALASLLFFLLFLTCQPNNQAIIDEFDRKSEKIASKYVPDRSLNVFNAVLKADDGKWIVEGESTVKNAQVALNSLIDSLLSGETFENNFELLPQEQFGDSVFGIISISVANMRSDKRHASELVNQCIMGQVVKLLKRKGGWYLIQTDYGYIGWVTGDSFEKTDRNGINDWEKKPKVLVKALSGFIYEKADKNSIPLTDIVVNMQLRLLEKGSKWTKVATPDKSEGYIITNYITEKIVKNPQAEDILKTAKSMMGVPYLWGGNSSKGNDCSGFTHTVFKKNGVQLPRDARQQVLVGKEIIPDEKFSNVFPGDLIFFGYNGRITHVGISLGGMDFIDQGGKVAFNSLDSTSTNYSAFRKRTFKKVKRVLN